MSIQRLSDEQLHQNLLSLKSRESRILAAIISHLEEVYRRRLFADFQCSSIYDYCIRILGYSNGDAHKKISACKLASVYPDVKSMVADGELSLSNAASVQTFLNQSRKTSTGSDQTATAQIISPKEIVERVKNKTTRECEQVLEEVAIERKMALPDRKPTARNHGDKTQVKASLDREQLQLLKSRLGITCEEELLQKLVTEKLQQTELKTSVTPRPRKAPSKKPRSISPAKRTLVFRQANKSCQNCGSKHNLQIDHIVSVAKGGSNDADNLRVLCRSCNQRAAVVQLGLGTMDKHINSHPLRRSHCGSNHSANN